MIEQNESSRAKLTSEREKLRLDLSNKLLVLEQKLKDEMEKMRNELTDKNERDRA